MAGFPSIKDEVQDEIVDVNIVGGSSAGTQYTEGDTDASITGTAIMWEDASDTLRAVSASNPLPVEATIDTTGLATSAKQDTIIGHLDGVESLLTDIEAAVDGLEAKDYATSAKQDTIIGHVDGIEGAVDQIEGYMDGVEGLLTTIDADTGVLAGAVSGAEVQVDIVAALPTGSNVVGRVGHDITGIGHGVKTVTTAGTDEALAASTACKRVVIQAQTDNTGWIAVGATGVDATVATGTGVLLGAGDAFELEIDNLADVFIDSTVNGDGVRYTYFT